MVPDLLPREFTAPCPGWGWSVTSAASRRAKAGYTEIGIGFWPDCVSARRGIENWINHHNSRRLHSARLRNRPPHGRVPPLL